jgi:hypothetical protein
MINKVDKVMYMKFNNNQRRGTLLCASKEGAVVIDRSFKEILNEVLNEEDVNVIKEEENKTEELEVTLLWQEAIHKNYLRVRGEL